LFGSLPEWKLADNLTTAGKAFRESDRILDAAKAGPTWLKDPRVANAVVETLRAAHHDRGLCEIVGYVVMSNHVHLLMKPKVPLAEVMKWIKGVSARKANEILRRTGSPFWRQESYDHWVRNWDEHLRILGYIEANPVKASLVEAPEQWPWSSAAAPRTS